MYFITQCSNWRIWQLFSYTHFDPFFGVSKSLKKFQKSIEHSNSSMKHHIEKMKLRLPTASTWLFLILVAPVHCQFCQNAFGNFQEILQTRQLAGRSHKTTKMVISKQRVITKMECLDICLRTEECGSFDMNLKNKFWICLIIVSRGLINRRVNPQDTIPELVKQGSSKGWLHFNVSSQELHEVSLIDS